MRIHKIQIWRMLIQIAEWGHWWTAAFYFDWLKNPQCQARILREEARDKYMPTSVYGIRRVYLWPIVNHQS